MEYAVLGLAMLGLGACAILDWYYRCKIRLLQGLIDEERRSQASIEDIVRAAHEDWENR